MTKDEENSANEAIEYMLSWLRKAGIEIVTLASETGKAQERTIGMHDDTGRTLLQVHFTCEPRQFAKKTFSGLWAPVFESLA